MTTIDENADIIAETASVLADAGPWGDMAMYDVLDAVETLSRAAADRLPPAAALHLRAAAAAAAAAVGELDRAAPERPRAAAARRGRRRGLGPGAAAALRQTP
ncbi:hypothetical protein HHL19_35720 [Streptomyces sp. R302]|uniref:hypothetical protein n=1 Tax=unclassified Streptomyces TaxID=2593676 RepID=UPI00145C6791|nr:MULTISPECIES: hypothetical protein [unclassified Streptomyces]NML55111.1 hypothetical protein [Streptomyces sp. R301]NML83859.1 hypothetical protein [Streptomyces sp. R302]